MFPLFQQLLTAPGGSSSSRQLLAAPSSSQASPIPRSENSKNRRRNFPYHGRTCRPTLRALKAFSSQCIFIGSPLKSFSYPGRTCRPTLRALNDFSTLPMFCRGAPKVVPQGLCCKVMGSRVGGVYVLLRKSEPLENSLCEGCCWTLDPKPST